MAQVARRQQELAERNARLAEQQGAVEEDQSRLKTAVLMGAGHSAAGNSSGAVTLWFGRRERPRCRGAATPRRGATTMPPDVGRYCIEISDAETDEAVIFTEAEWTDEEKRAAVAQILRLAGPSNDSWLTADSEPKTARMEPRPT